MATDYFPMYHRYYEQTKNLSDQELGRLVRALLKYSMSEEKEELAGRESMAFNFIVYDIDQTKKKYVDTCNKNRRNVQQRYEHTNEELPTATKSTTVYDRIPTTTNSTKSTNTIQNNTIQVKEESSTNVELKKKSPPSLDEITDYCVNQRHNDVDPKKFYDYYSPEWKDRDGRPVKNWKQKVITWESRNGKATSRHEPTSREILDMIERGEFDD